MQQIPDDVRGVLDYGGYIGAALMGSFTRASRWRDDATGKLLWWRMLSEIPIAIAVGAISAGVGEYRHFDPKIIGGIAALLGLLGAPFLTSLGEVALSILKKRFGSN